MAVAGDSFTQSNVLEFRGTKHEVEISVRSAELLEIQIENCDTYEQWNGKYDITYIEELSHKTGNFKQFGIFCSMLESAILENSESVTLDLLTYEDLKILREQNLGENRKKRSKHVDPKLQTKRYLIMTYTVEFDQIHYPLPLTYTGCCDPTTLKAQVRELKEKIRELKLERSSTHGSNYNDILAENKELKKEVLSLQSKMKDISSGNVSKELRVLKKVVQNLENDLLKERNKHQRQTAKKKKEYDELLEEFEELKSNERNFRVRCKSLTEELAMLKRNSRLSPVVNNKGRRNVSSNKKVTPISSNNTNTRGRSKTRSISRERKIPRERSMSGSSIGGRTPSPGSFQRFDPSAYIKEKERKRQEAEANRSRRRTPSSNTKRTPSTYDNRFSKPPSGGFKGRSSSKRQISRTSSFDSDAGSISRLKQVKIPSAKRSENRRRVKSVISDTSDDEQYRPHIPKARVTPLRSKSKSPSKSYAQGDDSENHSIGIAEIDARLEALQKFMKDNMD